MDDRTRKLLEDIRLAARVGGKSLRTVCRDAGIRPDRGYRIFRYERPPHKDELASLRRAVGLSR